MLRYTILSLLCCMFFVDTRAQTIKATVFENHTRVTLQGIFIRNLSNKESAITDVKGKFSLKAKLNDLLVFTGYGYLNDTLLVTNLKMEEVFLEPKTNMLNQVDISTPEVNTGSGWSDPAFHNQTTIYQRNADGSYKGGVAFRIWSSKGAEHKRQKLAQKQAEEEVNQQILKVFTAKNLAKYLPLPPVEIEGFITRYTPGAKVYTANDFNLLAYLDKCYKEYMKLPPEKRVPVKLAAPGK
ncbi:hypothetical protein HQ865_06820 [Mucilaginibacter mali]|uniref:Carboxypeptidase-like regulatory domain-containing protein n=1 Tax=Mucilaginibacter mali TaxID=2740462 RepID=A0A7D4TWG9_9SPHI|nr:hypothetical protein [Mucilaginibacter mali]QKJ29477.1 hypothetical protein HQ865_06820 [Mucilaginibacter mali]